MFAGSTHLSTLQQIMYVTRVCHKIANPIYPSFQLNMKLEKIDFVKLLVTLLLQKLERLKYDNVVQLIFESVVFQVLINTIMGISFIFCHQKRGAFMNTGPRRHFASVHPWT